MVRKGYAKLSNVNRSPGKGPGHDRSGPCHRPQTERPPCQDGSCVLPFFRRPHMLYAEREPVDVAREKGRGGVFTSWKVESRIAFVSTNLHLYTQIFTSTDQPTGGSESVERAKRASAVFASAVGPARATSDRMEGGPTGTTDLPGGGGRGRGGRGGGAYRTLHYAAAMVRTPENHCLERSTSIQGGVSR